MKAYEVLNPDVPEMNIAEQIEAGCNDWCIDGHSGHQYFGHTAAAARQNAAAYFYK